MTVKPEIAFYIDPPSEHFLEDRLFDTRNPQLNRDDSLLPFARLRDHLALQGVTIHTADYLRRGQFKGRMNHYWSIGMLNFREQAARLDDVIFRGFVLLEPPLVAPSLYRALPLLTRLFEQVFVHNITGDGYSLEDVDQSRLRKFYWPQPYNDVIEPYWSKSDRFEEIVVIAGNHNPRGLKPEYYSQRIEAVAELSSLDSVHLFGRGWNRWWSRNSMWRPYWKNRRTILRAYRGSCDSKLATLSNYRFSLCLENMPMEGYVTEKIFDCFYAGTVPIYKGGRHIEKYLPAGTFVDASIYRSWRQLWDAVKSMPPEEWETYRKNARTFLVGQGGRKYFESLNQIVGGRTS